MDGEGETFSGAGSTLRRRRRSPGRTPDLGRTETRGPGRVERRQNQRLPLVRLRPGTRTRARPVRFWTPPGRTPPRSARPGPSFPSRCSAGSRAAPPRTARRSETHESCGAVYARRSGGIGPLATLPAGYRAARDAAHKIPPPHGATTRIPTVMDCNCVSRLVRISSFFTPRKLKCLAGAPFDFIVCRAGAGDDGCASGFRRTDERVRTQHSRTRNSASKDKPRAVVRARAVQEPNVLFLWRRSAVVPNSDLNQTPPPYRGRCYVWCSFVRSLFIPSFFLLSTPGRGRPGGYRLHGRTPRIGETCARRRPFRRGNTRGISRRVSKSNIDYYSQPPVNERRAPRTHPGKHWYVHWSGIFYPLSADAATPTFPRRSNDRRFSFLISVYDHFLSNPNRRPPSPPAQNSLSRRAELSSRDRFWRLSPRTCITRYQRVYSFSYRHMQYSTRTIRNRRKIFISYTTLSFHSWFFIYSFRHQDVWRTT